MRVTIEAITTAAVRLAIYDDDEKPMTVATALVSPEDLQRLADAAVQACGPAA